MMSYSSLVVMAAVMMVAVTAAPSTRPNSAALARVLVPVVRHRLEEGRALPPGLMEELVTDLEESEPHMRHLHDAAGKREFDDYGHMRFGKRTGVVEYDDYGHLRFGRSTDGGFDDEEEGKFEGRNGSSRSTRHSTVQNPIRPKKH